VLARVGAVPGFDLGATLQQLGGRRDILLRTLERFARLYANGVEALRAPVGPDPRAAWREASHTLRGACAQTGFSQLAERLRAFEQAAAAGRDLAGLQAEALAIDDLLRETVAALAQSLIG
jgi:HPt (histidine-containing phosphotransfer) domain-containing protein